MFRRSDLIRSAALAPLLIALLAAGARARADDVASYLEQRGMKSLLATHIERKLERAAGDARNELVQQLATLYAQMLEEAGDPPQRISIEEKCRRLLQQAPDAAADELRLALYRASYRGAEKIAESHRLRLASPEDFAAAQKTFADLSTQVTSLRQRLKENLEAVDRRLSRAAGSEAASLDEQVEKARSLLAQCLFLNAWTLYYQSWVNDRPESAKVAEGLFAPLLAPDNNAPQPSDVSVDLRSGEWVARSILGMALCKSISSSAATALAWIDLLEQPNTFEAVRAEAPAWRLVVLMDHQEYRQALDFVQSRNTESPAPLAWLRLVAVNALEDDGRDRQAAELARFAVTALASRGELDQVLDLARRFGTQSLGDSGFALQYVRGVIKYQEARQSHDSEDPTLDPAIIAKYEEAAASLNAAVNEADASKYGVAAAACRRLAAWCRYFQSRFLDARKAFEEASAALSGDESAEALWMAVVSLDKLVQPGGKTDLNKQLNELVDRFLTQFPSSEHAPKLRLRRVVTDKQATPRAVQELLSIPPNSDVYDAARRQASDLLYQMFRDASGPRKAVYATQFLSVAVPLLGAGARDLDLAKKEETQRFVARCRQVLEVSLADGVDRVIAARTALDALNELKGHAEVDTGGWADELAARTVQERLLAGDEAAAAAIADDLWNRDPASVWTRLAARAMFKHAYDQWKGQDVDPAKKNAALDVVVRHGGRVLREFTERADGMDQPGAFAYFIAVADATMAQWEQTGDVERGKAALFLYQSLLDRRPRSATFLRSVAVLAEALGDRPRALDCWRRLVAGLPPEAPGWYEAKFRQIDLLARSDPALAREIMDQHKQLHPDFGPDPWGAKLKGLDASIPAASAPAGAAGAAGGSGGTSP